MHPTWRAAWGFLGKRWEEEAPARVQPGKGICFVLIPRLTPEDIAFLHNLHAPHAVLGHAMVSLHIAMGRTSWRVYMVSCCTTLPVMDSSPCTA